VERIGVLGTGTQARLQLIQLDPITECREVLVWGRGDDQLERYRTEMEQRGFRVETTRRSQDLLRRCNLVVSTTPSTEPLLYAADLAAGTHITAVGSDTPHKQELEAEIVGRADLIVADSLEQCLLRGEIHKAIEAGQTTADELVELGHVIAGRAPGRTREDQISVADLTGIAVQDLNIAEAVLSAVD
jgi:ornithine cyclodeaminase